MLICSYEKKKYSKANRAREKLTFLSFSVDEKVRQSALEKCEEQLISLSTEELIAKEAYYHSSCYSTYNFILYHRDRGNATNTQSISDIAYPAIKIHLTNLYKNPDVVEFTKYTKEAKAKLSSAEYDPKEIDSAKRNIKKSYRKSLRTFSFCEY